jgi:uncharacterized protein
VRPPRRRSSRSVFIDSSAYFALLNRRDASHESVTKIGQRLLNERRDMVTTSFILAETHALLLNRLNRQIATDFLLGMAGSRTKVEWVTEDDVVEARSLIVSYADKYFSLADATSFIVMERLGIDLALTLDHNFTEYGRFTVLPANP